MKEPARNFLSRADLGKRSVPGRLYVDVDAERLVVGAQCVHPHEKSMHQARENGQSRSVEAHISSGIKVDRKYLLEYTFST
jgi:hypothetical protein